VVADLIHFQCQIFWLFHRDLPQTLQTGLFPVLFNITDVFTSYFSTLVSITSMLKEFSNHHGDHSLPTSAEVNNAWI
jgi:hypothetical protein